MNDQTPDPETPTNTATTAESAERNGDTQNDEIEIQAMGSAKVLKPGSLVLISPDRLTPHPDLARFPELSKEEFARLDQSVLERNAIIDPIKINTRYQILDGRNRWKAAKHRDLSKIPAIVMPDSEDPIDLAITTSTARRQLSKSFIALILFEQHPLLRIDRDTKKKRGIKMEYPGSNRDEQTKLRAKYDAVNSYRELSRVFQIPNKYFTYLNEMWDFSSEREWEEVRAAIMTGEADVTRLISGFAGRKSTKSHKRKAPNRFKLALKGITNVLPQRIGSHWERFSAKERDLLTQGACKAFKAMPRPFVEYLLKDLTDFLEAEEG